MAKVFIGVDPHKLSATIEAVDEREMVLATGRFDTDKVGYAAMRKTVSRWPDRVWAIEGSNGAGRPLAQRLLADGEHVVDVPAKLSARARLFDTGHNRKTDAHDAHAVAAVAVRTQGLRVLSYDGDLETLRMLADAPQLRTVRVEAPSQVCANPLVFRLCRFGWSSQSFPCLRSLLVDRQRVRARPRLRHPTRPRSRRPPQRRIPSRHVPRRAA